ncbi:MAG: xanthine dehydrogenase family protein [Planctomycetes bacterium]|nr:xanthine dehydrogenase family protein [Planctomycetota bacterium]
MPTHSPADVAVGRSPPRVDGAAKVSGRALYVDDLPCEDAWHGATVRSSVPHGRLRGVHLDRAFDWSDVTVVTAADIRGCNVVSLIEGDQPALVPVGGTIRHVAEPVALVAASTRARAFAAAAAVRLEVDELPAALDLDAALRADALVHGDDNVMKTLRIAKGDEVERALAGCDLVIEGVYETGAQEQMYIEPQGMLAHWDEHGACHVTGSMQCPYYVHSAMKVLFGLDDAHAIVTQAVTGGGFGGKEEYPSMLALHAALLARAAGRPVKIVYDREEDVAATTKRHPSRVRHRLGLMRDGTFVAADVDLVLDGGAYVTLTPVVLSRAVLHAAGPYRLPHVRVVGRALATNTPPHGAFRGFGAPQAIFATERQVDRAARALGVDPWELRRKNALRAGDTTSTGQVLEHSVGSLAVLDALRRVAPSPRPDHEGSSSPAWPPPRDELPDVRLGSPVRRGRGIAFCMHGAGFTGSGEQRLAGRASVATRPDGGFEVRSSSTDIGQGAFTTFAQIAADALGVDGARVSVLEPTTDRVPDSGPTVASRTCMVVGKVVEDAATALRAHLLAWGRAHGLSGADLGEIARAHVRDVGEAERTVTYAPPPGIAWDDESYTGSAYPVYGWAACLVDVAVDDDTHEVTIERCVHAVDVGHAIHPVMVQGQIEGGTLQALGWALLEAVKYGGGRVLNPRMTDCIIPTSADAPKMETLLVESPYPFGPHGAKGVGEIPMDGPAAAAANALADALGIEPACVPMLPETIAAARAAREGAT